MSHIRPAHTHDVQHADIFLKFDALLASNIPLSSLQSKSSSSLTLFPSFFDASCVEVCVLRFGRMRRGAQMISVAFKNRLGASSNAIRFLPSSFLFRIWVRLSFVSPSSSSNPLLVNLNLRHLRHQVSFLFSLELLQSLPVFLRGACSTCSSPFCLPLRAVYNRRLLMLAFDVLRVFHLSCPLPITPVPALPLLSKLYFSKLSLSSSICSVTAPAPPDRSASPAPSPLQRSHFSSSHLPAKRNVICDWRIQVNQW